MLTQERLKELFSYDPDTGIFTRKIHSRGTVRIKARTSLVYEAYTIDGVSYLASKLAFLYMTGTMPSGTVDHINRDIVDDRWVNLRLVTASENSRNRKLPSNNKSGLLGVWWEQSTNLWRGRITTLDGVIVKRSFGTLLDAAAWRISTGNRNGYL